MSGWTAKRFWTKATAETVEGGFTVRLDGRPVKTPAKAALTLPSRTLAEAIAAEWDAQTGVVKPAAMPLARAANSAIDKVAPMRDAVIAELAGYGGTDLICYRAEAPEALIAAQAAAWDPLVDWAATALRAPLRITQGVIPVAQAPDSLSRLTDRVAALSDFELAGLHDLVAISGSLVLALAVAEGRFEPEAAFDLSRVDNRWQSDLWGADAEEAETEALRRAAFLQAHRFLALCR